MTDKAPTCATCRFFDADEPIIRRNDSSGRCKRFPPGWVLGIGEKMDVRTVCVQQPVTFAADWCGEHQPRETGIDARPEEK